MSSYGALEPKVEGRDRWFARTQDTLMQPFVPWWQISVIPTISSVLPRTSSIPEIVRDYQVSSVEKLNSTVTTGQDLQMP